MKLIYEHVDKSTCPHIALLRCGQVRSPQNSGVHIRVGSTFRPGSLGYSYKSELTPIDL